MIEYFQSKFWFVSFRKKTQNFNSFFFLLRLERAAPAGALPGSTRRARGQHALPDAPGSPRVRDDQHVVERDRPPRRGQDLQEPVLVGSRLRGGHGAVLEQRRVARRAHLGLEVDGGRLAVVGRVREAEEVAVGGAVAVARNDE